MTTPRFTHKDYVLIAETIASLPESITRDNAAIRQDVAEAFADALRGTNPAFDRARFIACATGKPVTRRDVSR